MERPKALDSLVSQEPCVVLSTTDDPRAGEVEHLILMVSERDAILTYIEQLQALLDDAESALRSALEDCHPSVEAYFKRHPEADKGVAVRER